MNVSCVRRADGEHEDQVVGNPAIDQVAEPLSKAVRAAYEAAGPVRRQAKNALHGVWLGHPLHPVFTDVPLGAWTTALALDAAANGDPGMRRAATFATGVGLAARSALPSLDSRTGAKPTVNPVAQGSSTVC
jgi:hypothetical protein